MGFVNFFIPLDIFLSIAQDKQMILKTRYGTKVEFSNFHDDELITINHFGYSLEILIDDLCEESKRILEELKKKLTKM